MKIGDYTIQTIRSVVVFGGRFSCYVYYDPVSTVDPIASKLGFNDEADCLTWATSEVKKHKAALANLKAAINGG